MATIIKFARRHGRAPIGSGLRNASIGTDPPDISLSRLARPSEASFRPAKMLRKCAPEHSAASAIDRTVIPLASAQRIIGCASDMGADISARNTKSQPEIFPTEISLSINGLLKCDMGKRLKPEPREIFLGDWLKRFEIGASEAATIAGCTQSYISNISGGRRGSINALYLLKLSEHMNVSVNDFFHLPPTQSQVAALKRISPKARAAILDRKQKKA